MGYKDPPGFHPTPPVEREMRRVSCVILLVTSVASGCLMAFLVFGGLLIKGGK